MGLPAAEVARRAGAKAELVQELTDRGLAVTEEDGNLAESSVGLVRLLAAFDRAGMRLDAIQRGLETGELDFRTAERFFEVPPSFGGTYADVARRVGCDVRLVRRLVVALGLPQPGAGEPVREDEADLLVSFLQLWETPALDEVVTLARIYGQNVRRIAESEVAFFYDAVTSPVVASDLPYAEQADLVQRQAAAATAMSKRIVPWLHTRHFEDVLVESFVADTERFLDERGLAPARPVRPPAIAFLDLTGYTRLTAERGDEEAARLAAEVAALVEETALAHGGRAVKWLGDGVMFHFSEPRDALAGALELVECVPAAGLPPARVGVNAGPVVFREGDYYGRTVNVAARIADYARPREVLVSAAVTEEVPTPAGVEYEEIGDIPLKGVPEPVPLFRARPR